MKLLWGVKHLFIPQFSNNHKARILHPASLSVLVALFLVVQFTLNFFALVSPAVLGYASDISTETIVELTNQKRMESGLTPLKLNGKLIEIASRKAGDMFAFNYWAHTSPSGRDPWSFFREVGYDYTYAGENLARDFMDSSSVAEAWMNSLSHKDNILNRHYTEIGIAVVNGNLNGVETTLVVQTFGTPRSVTATKNLPLQKPNLGQAVATSSAPSKIILSKASEGTTAYPTVSPFALTKTLAIFLLGLVFGALAVDAFLVYRQKIVRLSGKNIAHLIFIGAILLAALLTTQGAIL